MEIILGCLFLVCFLGLLFCVVMQVRNNLVYKFRIRIVNEKGSELYEWLGSYNSMLFDFSCWTEKQFMAKHFK